MRSSRQSDTQIKVNVSISESLRRSTSHLLHSAKSIIQMSTEVDTDRTVLYDTYELKQSNSRKGGQEDSEAES